MPQTFLVSNRVQFRDTDAAGIMHFSAFITYMEQAEHAFLRSLDMSVMKFRIDQMEISWPRVSVQCDYVAPLRFEQEFTVSLTIEKLGRKSVRYGFQFSSNCQNIAKGQISAACCIIRNDDLSSIPIPDAIRQILLPFSQDDGA